MDSTWYERNRDRKLAYAERYRKENSEKVKESQSRYYEQNKEKWTQYYKDNKEKKDAYKAEKIACDVCGAEVSRKHMARHKKTDKCKLEEVRKEVERLALVAEAISSK